MKVLLIQPPIEDFYDTRIRTYPLSLLCLATKIRDMCDVTLLDLRSNRKPIPLQEHPFPELRPYYRPGTRTPFSLFTRYFRFGAGSEEIRGSLQEHRPDVVCISSLFSAYAFEAMEVARIAKKVDNSIITILGGTHPTIFPQQVLGNPFVDYVIRGEGETPLFNLLQHLRKGTSSLPGEIPGVCSKRGNGLHISEIHIETDIDLIPDRKLVNADAYRIGRNRYSFFLTSRGCPFQCAFCGRPPVPYRKRSLSTIEKELTECLDLGISAIDFEDDMVSLNKPFFQKILRIFSGKDLVLSAMNGIYAETLDEETLEMMYAAGFRRLNFSLVDRSESVVLGQRRPVPATFLALLPYLESSPFLVEVHFIIGLPEQTPNDIVDTIIFLMGKRVLPGPSIFYLAPNSSLFDCLTRGDKPGDPDFRRFRSSCMFPVNPMIIREGLYTFMKLVRFVNFIKQVVDREGGITNLSHVLDLPVPAKREHEREILSILLKERRFVSFHPGTRTLVEESQDRDLVQLFFDRAKGHRIKGFKTGQSVRVD